MTFVGICINNQQLKKFSGWCLLLSSIALNMSLKYLILLFDFAVTGPKIFVVIRFWHDIY